MNNNIFSINGDSFKVNFELPLEPFLTVNDELLSLLSNDKIKRIKLSIPDKTPIFVSLNNHEQKIGNANKSIVCDENIYSCLMDQNVEFIAGDIPGEARSLIELINDELVETEEHFLGVEPRCTFHNKTGLLEIELKRLSFKLVKTIN